MHSSNYLTYDCLLDAVMAAAAEVAISPRQKGQLATPVRGEMAIAVWVTSSLTDIILTLFVWCPNLSEKSENLKFFIVDEMEGGDEILNSLTVPSRPYVHRNIFVYCRNYYNMPVLKFS